MAASKDVATVEKTGQAIAPYRQPSEYALMVADKDHVDMVIEENIKAIGGLKPFDLDRIKIPTGGGTAWSIPTGVGDDVESEVAVQGVVLHMQQQRAFWKASFEDSGGGTPPDCQSPDSIKGHGDPGVLCAYCPNAKFGTAMRANKPARGQACKQIMAVYFIRPDDFLPTVISLPPTSIQPMRGYIQSLTRQGKVFWQVVTEFRLGTDKNQDGIRYSYVKARDVTDITDAAIKERLRSLKTAIAGSVGTVVDLDNFETIRSSDNDMNAAA